MKTYFVVFLIALSCTIVSCGTSPSKTKTKIGLLMDNLDNQRWKRDRDLFKLRIEEQGGEVLVEVAGGNEKKQYDQAKSLIEKGVQVLVVIPVNMEKAAAIVELAHNSNVKVITYDRLINNCDVDYYVSFDNVQVGELQAEYITTLKPKGNYILIGGSKHDNNSMLVHLGQLTILQPMVDNGDIKILYDQYMETWSQEAGYNAMKECMANYPNQIDAVLAANDDLAQGIIKALTEQNLQGKVLVTGQDADLFAIKSIKNGLQTMTVYKSINELTKVAASFAMTLAKDEIPEGITISVNNGKKLVPSFLLNSQIVQKATIESTVIKDGYWTEEDLK